MPDLDRQMHRFYDAEATRARVIGVRVQRGTVSRQLIALVALAVVVSLGALVLSGDARLLPASGRASAPGDARLARITLSGRAPIALPGTICRIAAAGNLMLAAVADTGDPSGACHLAISGDGGVTWRQDATSSAVLSVAIAPRGDLFAGLADGTVLRSSDAHSWTAVAQIPTARSSPGVISFGFGSDALWAGGVGVLRSTDGTHWDDVTGGLGSLAADARQRPAFGVVGLVPRADGVIAAIAGNVPEVGVWTLDSSGGWRRIAPARLGQPLGLVRAGTVLVLLTQRGSIAPDGSTTPAAWMSPDDGATWQASDHGPGSGAVLRNVAFTQDTALAAAADGVVELVGTSWQAVPGAESGDTDARALVVSGSGLYVITSHSLVRYQLQSSP